MSIDKLHKKLIKTKTTISIAESCTGGLLSSKLTKLSGSSKYFKMLEAGGSKHHSDLLAPFGLNASDAKFWSKGLSVISSMIDELEKMK